MLWFYCLVLLSFRQRIPALLSFSDISKLSPLGCPFNPSYEIVSIPTMIVNAYPRDLVPQREYFLQEGAGISLKDGTGSSDTLFNVKIPS